MLVSGSSGRVRHGDLFRHVPWLLAAFVLFLAVFPVQGGRVAGRLQFVGAFGWPALPKWLSLGIVFLLAFLLMAAIAEGVGRLFIRFEPLEAYRWDILGSILGIGAFSALAFLHASPLVWGAIAAVIYLTVGPRARLTQVVSFGVAVVVLGILSFAPNTQWSPYYRVTTLASTADDSIGIRVNGRPHQRIMPLAVMEETQTHRFEPYEHAPDEPPHGRADHRRRQRQRRDDRARPRRRARRCRGDRPAAVSARSRPSPRPPVSGPARDRAHRGRPVVPPRYRAPIRPRPVRDPRFAHCPRRSVIAAPRELPAHPGSDARRSTST